MAKLPHNWKELAAKSGFTTPRDYAGELWSPYIEDMDLSDVLQAFAEKVLDAVLTANPQVTAWVEIAKTFEAFRNGELQHCDTSALVAALNKLTAALLEGK